MLREADEAMCPVCDQPLSPEHREHVAAQLSTDRDMLAERFMAANLQLKELGERKATLDAEERDLAQAARRGEARRQQAAKAEAALADCENAAAELVGLREQRAQVAERLEQRGLRDGRAGRARRVARANRRSRLRCRGPRAAPRRDRRVAAVRRALSAPLAARARCRRRSAEALRGPGRADRAPRRGARAQDAARRAELQRAVAGLPALQAEAARGRAEHAERPAFACRRAQQKEGAAQQQLDSLDAASKTGAASCARPWTSSTRKSPSSPSFGMPSARRASRP